MSSSSNEPGSHDGTSDRTRDRQAPLYFFPEEEITELELREILAGSDAARRAWAISHLLRYAQWEDIWTYVDRDEVREIFSELEMPENLRAAWARMLKVETPVG